MNSIGKSLTAALTLAIVSVLGIGPAIGAEHHQHTPPLTAPVSVSAPGALPAPPGPAPGDGQRIPAPTGPVVPEGFPHELHREERLLDDEREHTEAAPHTLARFDSGSP